MTIQFYNCEKKKTSFWTSDSAHPKRVIKKTNKQTKAPREREGERRQAVGYMSYKNGDYHGQCRD